MKTEKNVNVMLMTLSKFIGIILKFKKILIRVRFKWIEGEGELMNDEADTALGIQAADENAKTIFDRVSF